jgi:hypothetical protein
MLSFILSILFFIFAIIVLIAAAFQVSYSFSKDKIGFLPSLSAKLTNELEKTFYKYLKDPSKYEFIELGAGVANIAGYVAKTFEFKKVVAVEIDPFVIFFGRLLNSFSTKPIEFIRKNLFDYEIPKKSVLYCYLGHTILEKMYKEGRLDGHLVISTTFRLEGVLPAEVIDMKNFYRRLYIYDFRGKLS